MRPKIAVWSFGVGVLLAAGTLSYAQALAGIVVDDTSVDAAEKDGGVTAAVKVINTTDALQAIEPTAVVGPSCTARIIDNSGILKPTETSTVNLTLDQDCFPTGTAEINVALRIGTESLPTVTIKNPADTLVWSDWIPLLGGFVVGGAIAYRVYQSGVNARKKAASALSEEFAASAGNQYRELQDVVGQRVDDLRQFGAPGLQWKPSVAEPAYGWEGEVGNLEAGWSLTTSWATNLTVTTSAVVALLSSTSIIEAIVGAASKPALAIATMTSLLGAVLVAVAATLVKVIGPSPKVVTVRGLVHSTWLLAGTAVLQTVTFGLTAALLLWENSLAVTAVVVLAILVTVVLTRYCSKTLTQGISSGKPLVVKPVPADALTAWKASSSWEAQIVSQRIRAEFKDYLEEASQPELDLYPHAVPYSYPTSPGDDRGRWWTSPTGLRGSMP